MHLLLLDYLRHFSLMTSNDFTVKTAVLKQAESRAFLTYTTAMAEPVFSGKT